MAQHTIVFRADGSSTVGLGHVHRLLSLAQMLHKSFDCVFVSHEPSETLVKELDKLSIKFIQTKSIAYKIPDEYRAGDEVEFDMDAQLKGNEIVVLDGYWFGKKYQQAVKDKGCTLVYVDDLTEEGNIADIIINHSMGINISDYKNIAPATSVYTGSNYSLVTVPEKFRYKKQYQNLYNQLLIAMGGADPLNFTCKILEEQKDFISRFNKAVVLVGGAYNHIEKLKQAAAGFSSVEIVQGLSKDEVFALMQQSSSAILSSSTMAVEYASVGGMLFVIQTGGNQKYLYKGLIENKVAMPLQEVSQVNDEIVKTVVTRQQQIFDGKSNERFIKLFNELQVQASLSFVKAGAEHLHTTFEWASDATVRAYSFNQNPINFKEHQNWFLKKIEQPGCIYLLCKWDNNFVGSLRFDITNDDALISYLVSPKYHGKGLGRSLLAEGLEYLAQNNSSVITATGYVMPQNIASVKVFERLGFSCTTENNQLCFKKIIHR